MFGAVTMLQHGLRYIINGIVGLWIVCNPRELIFKALRIYITKVNVNRIIAISDAKLFFAFFSRRKIFLLVFIKILRLIQPKVFSAVFERLQLFFAERPTCACVGRAAAVYDFGSAPGRIAGEHQAIRELFVQLPNLAINAPVGIACAPVKRGVPLLQNVRALGLSRELPSKSFQSSSVMVIALP